MQNIRVRAALVSLAAFSADAGMQIAGFTNEPIGYLLIVGAIALLLFAIAPSLAQGWPYPWKKDKTQRLWVPPDVAQRLLDARYTTIFGFKILRVLDRAALIIVAIIVIFANSYGLLGGSSWAGIVGQALGIAACLVIAGDEIYNRWSAKRVRRRRGLR